MARADAATYCISPKIDQIVGRCPTGYFTSQGCCEPFHNDKAGAIPKKGGTCPSKFYPSGNFCVPH